LQQSRFTRGERVTPGIHPARYLLIGEIGAAIPFTAISAGAPAHRTKGRDT
jgi:hypothetical protein